MSKINGNHGAFAMPETKTSKGQAGLTKREYFAAMAMQGIIAADIEDNMDSNYIAQNAIECADALIAELNEI